MRLIKVGSAVLNQTPLDWEKNREHILSSIRQAREQQASVLCLPELCITGYGCEDAFLAPDTLRTAFQILRELVPETERMIVSVGLPVSYNNRVFNCSALIVDRRIAGFAAKRYLARSGIHYEPRWFKPWPVRRSVSLRMDGEEYPFGDLFFDCGGVRISFEICEDAWVADRPGGNMFLKGIDVILNPSASHFAFEKQKVRERFVLEGSRAFGVTYIFSNLMGNEAGRAIYDGGAMIASNGKILSAGRRFSYRDVLLTTATADLDITRMNQAAAAGHDHLEENPLECVSCDFSFPEVPPGDSAAPLETWETGSHLKEEEFTRAIALGLFDYLRKSRSHGFVVSLSGGADSSAVACLVSIMIHLAVRDLGTEGFTRKLGHMENLRGINEPRQLVNQLLNCAYQSTRHSSETTRSAARQVAEAVGARFFEFDVEHLVQGYVDLVSSGIGRELTWEDDDLALQNIQARVRAPGIWLLANLNRALLLATSNRSEAAVGYATMDGDTCGGLSPIAGIDKAFLRRWLRWLQAEGPDGFGSIPALSAVTSQVPTAELRPGGAQTDESDLMPYDLLDAIERAAIRDKKSPLEVYRLMRKRFPEYSSSDLETWVARFFRLWCRNQWKRERYAPSFHVDDENLDPKTWCRFPILSGGFARELEELKLYVGKDSGGD